MARQKGIIKIKGTVDDLTFYQSEDGHMVRKKTSIDKNRIATDPAFIRTRENGTEFGSFAKSGKLLRDAVHPMMITAKDSRVVARLSQQMAKIKNLDPTSTRGNRNVGVAIALAPAKLMLKGFNFNVNAVLNSTLFKPYAVNTGTGVVTINGLKPIDDLAFLQGATHVSIKSGWARVNFVTGAFDLKLSNTVNLPINGTSTNITLTPAAVPTGTGTDVFLIQIEFFQIINGIQYTLKNGSFNALSIIEVV
ncbi:MAG: hypothetical protein JWO32_1662 [Bacteroidetes bacterium]|nr:hypothetical protein [Bacteroidota bacterium]